jgi:hypothetical protein
MQLDQQRDQQEVSLLVNNNKRCRWTNIFHFCQAHVECLMMGIPRYPRAVVHLLADCVSGGASELLHYATQAREIREEEGDGWYSCSLKSRASRDVQ